jgi:hypothetical protein
MKIKILDIRSVKGETFEIIGCGGRCSFKNTESQRKPPAFVVITSLVHFIEEKLIILQN